MTEPTNFELLELATPYALDAVSDDERAVIERAVAAAPTAVADAFHEEVRAVRETLAAVSASTAVEPPSEVRTRVLAAITPPQRQSRWRAALLAAAAVLVVGLSALSVGLALRPTPTPSTAEQVFAAPDVHTVSTAIGGGTATVVFSREENAGVLVMNNVAPPKPDTVYQMWLIREGEPTSAGTMDAKTVGPSTTAVLRDIGNATTLAFTVEPGTGSDKPTTQPIAQLQLTT